MLEHLDDVDWSSLTHACGAAGDVPGYLRQLRSPDHGEREAALDALRWTIYLEGTVYEATAPAVGFLLEVVRDPSTQVRAGIVELLIQIAQATEGDLKAMRTALWQGWDFYNTFEGGKSGQPVVAVLLKHPNEMPRELETAVGARVERWIEDFKGTDVRERIRLASILEGAWDAHPKMLQMFKRQLKIDTDAEARVGLALLLLKQGRLGDEESSGFVQDLRAVGLPASVMDEPGIELSGIAGLSPFIVRRRVDCWAEIVRHAKEAAVQPLVRPILAFFFGGESENPTSWKRSADKVTEDQFQIILALVENDFYWAEGTGGLSLHRYGLPGSRRELRGLIS